MGTWPFPPQWAGQLTAAYRRSGAGDFPQTPLKIIMYNGTSTNVDVPFALLTLHKNISYFLLKIVQSEAMDEKTYSQLGATRQAGYRSTFYTAKLQVHIKKPILLDQRTF